MSRRRRSLWPWILLLLAAGGGGWWWWDQQNHSGSEIPEYEIATVTRGDVKKVVRASGEVNPIAKVEIGSQISGTIVKWHADFNAKVKAGDILCQLDPATYEASYAQAEAERASSLAERDYQQKTLTRKKQLLEKNLFAEADYDKAEADLKSAEARLMLADARLKRAKVDLDRCTIYAPIDGIIIDRTAEVGQTIAASFNAPKLFILANDLTKMQINAKVSEADIGQVQPGQKVSFKVDAYPDAFTGSVLQVRNSPIAEESVVNYDAVIAVDNPELKLKPGMTGDTDIIVGESTGALVVPNAALRFKPAGGSAGRPPRGGDSGSGGGPDGGSRRGGGAAGGGGKPDGPGKAPEKADLSARTVYLPPPSPAAEPVAAPVRTGISDGIYTEIKEGLKEGDTVITLLKPPAGPGGAVSNPLGGGGGMRRR